MNPGPPIALRLYSDILASLDQWIANQPEPKPKRTEAIRELLREALKNQ
jgi:metal-responsive CopG/Arc/MetJ family transcriptional regulator